MLNPRKSNPSDRCTIRVLSSLMARPRGCSHSANRALICSACCRDRQHTAKSSANLTSTGAPGIVIPACGPVLRYRAPAASSSPWSATFSSKGLITPPCGVPSSVGANPLPFSNTPAFSQARIRSLSGNEPSMERRWSWSIRSNAAARSASSTHNRFAFLPLIVLNRVSIASWQLRPGLKPYDLGSNRASHSGSNALRTRPWWHRSMITAHRHLHPAGGSQRDLLVHPGGRAAGIALRRLAHAEQRVRPGSQHHLLQGPNLRPVLLLRRLEDPSPQPPYAALVSAPVDGVPVGCRVLGSVHVPGSRRHRWGGERVSRHVSNLSLGSGSHLHWSFKGSPAHVSNPFGSGPQVRYPASYPPAATWGAATSPVVSCRLSATGICFLGILFSPGIPLSSRSACRVAPGP